MINRDRLVKTFLDLVKIDSPSGEEEAMAVELTGRLESLGMTVVRDDYGNLIAHKGEGDPIVFSSHMDTVEPGRGIKPIIEGDRIVSDGTTILGGDCKAGIAAVLEALESIKEDGVHPIPIEFVLTREEEPGLRGAHQLDFSKIKGKEAIILDGEGPISRITSSSPTYIGFEIHVTGRAAHAGMEPEKGISAIRIAAELITRLPQGRLDELTTFNIGLIKGGLVRNAVPATAKLTGEFRSVKVESIDALKSKLLNVIGEVRRMYPDAVIEEYIHTDFDAYSLTDDDPTVRRIKKTLLSLGMEPTMHPSGGGSDGNVFRGKGIGAVVVGMSDHGAHTTEEYVMIPDMVNAAHFCEAIVKA